MKGAYQWPTQKGRCFLATALLGFITPNPIFLTYYIALFLLRIFRGKT